MPPDVSSCAAKAGFTAPKIRKRPSRRQDTNATREIFIVFFPVKIEAPRDANTHDGHVKSRRSPPRDLRCLCGQRTLPATQFTAACRKPDMDPGLPLASMDIRYGPRELPRADWRLVFPTGRIPSPIGGDVASSAICRR